MFPIPPLPQLEAWKQQPQDDQPWLADSASVLQAKALLPTPRFCLPPPSYRPPRPPLFPVPPPGSCLLPPPPLPTTGDGLISPHSWQDSTNIPSFKGERWRKSSWTLGDFTTSPPSSAHPYTFQRAGQTRARTLVEVPLQADSAVVTRSEPRPINAVKAPLDVLHSTLDPTSRPFTPASFKSSLPSNSYEDSTATDKGTNEVTEEFSYFGKSAVQHHSKADACSDGSFSTSSLSKQEFSINSQQGSFFADDPHMEDFKFMLPDFDNFVDELHLQDDSSKSNRSVVRKITPDVGSNILPPPILPFASHWSGKSRPPLLPTPKNFPPYGPRTAASHPPIYEEVDEESFGSVLLSNPILQFPPATKSRNSAPNFIYKKPFTVDLDESNNNKKSPTFTDFQEEVNQVKKPDVVSMLLRDQASSTIGKPRLSLSSLQSESIPDESKDSNDMQDWDPSFPLLTPHSLLDCHPVPDEYMVAKVVGSKLPSIKLGNCHTDLLLFLFYVWVEDTMQQMAACLLFERGWRFHMLEKVWLARWPGVTPERKTCEWEEGLYQYFDVKAWRRIPGWFRLNYVQLAEKTVLVDQSRME